MPHKHTNKVSFCFIIKNRFIITSLTIVMTALVSLPKDSGQKAIKSISSYDFFQGIAYPHHKTQVP